MIDGSRSSGARADAHGEVSDISCRGNTSGDFAAGSNKPPGLILRLTAARNLANVAKHGTSF